MTKELATSDDMGIMVSNIMVIFGVVAVTLVMSKMVSAIISSVPLTQYAQAQAYGITVPQAYVAQAYFGIIDPRVLNATGETDWIDLIHNPPYTPWIAADFFNDGPDTVYIAINYPSVFFTLHSGESLKVDLTGADRRIEVIFYKTNLGEKALVRVIGKY